eukprot:3798091-Prymnesium_polylepis.1
MGRPQSCRYWARAGAAVGAVRCSRTKHVSCHMGSRGVITWGRTGSSHGVTRGRAGRAREGVWRVHLAVGLAAPFLVDAARPDPRRPLARLHVGRVEILRDLRTQLRRGRAWRALHDQQAMGQRPIACLQPLRDIGSDGGGLARVRGQEPGVGAARAGESAREEKPTREEGSAACGRAWAVTKDNDLLSSASYLLEVDLDVAREPLEAADLIPLGSGRV